MPKRICKCCTLAPGTRDELDRRLRADHRPVEILGWLHGKGHNDITAANVRYHRQEHTSWAETKAAQDETEELLTELGSSWQLSAQIRTVMIRQINRLNVVCKGDPGNPRVESLLTTASKVLIDHLSNQNFEAAEGEDNG